MLADAGWGWVGGAGDSEVGRGVRRRMQGEVLSSDMAAFKAANPGCCLEDFIRWHSPRDWVQGPDGTGGALSPRMAAQVGGHPPVLLHLRVHVKHVDVPGGALVRVRNRW